MRTKSRTEQFFGLLIVAFAIYVAIWHNVVVGIALALLGISMVDEF